MAAGFGWLLFRRISQVRPPAEARKAFAYTLQATIESNAESNVGIACVLGLSLLGVGCYNNPDVSSRPPGSGSKDIHSGPQVGPGTTAGGSTAGPQPAPTEEHENTSEKQKKITNAPARVVHEIVQLENKVPGVVNARQGAPTCRSEVRPW